MREKYHIEVDASEIEDLEIACAQMLVQRAQTVKRCAMRMNHDRVTLLHGVRRACDVYEKIVRAIN